jgi:hypothetical protein
MGVGQELPYVAVGSSVIGPEESGFVVSDIQESLEQIGHGGPTGAGVEPRDDLDGAGCAVWVKGGQLMGHILQNLPEGTWAVVGFTGLG